MKQKPTPKQMSRKECLRIAIDNERLQIENMKLRLDVERRTVEFLGQMQDFFGIVDSLFTEDDVRTLAEAKRKWYKFREVLDETQDLDSALDAIGRVSIADNEANSEMVMRLWSKDK